MSVPPHTRTLVERLTQLRQHQQDGKRSPHKPLLVLLALGRFARTGSSAMDWTEVEDRLGQLLIEFGPPRKGPAHPEFPFTRLRSDQVWNLSRDVPNDQLKDLRAEPITGYFPADIEAELKSDPSSIATVARLLVEDQFPLTVAPDVLGAVGLDPDVVFGSERAPKAQEQDRRRSSTWRHEILEAWDRSCAFCGFDGQLTGAVVGIEAAHVRWFNFGGPDDADNGLALCSLHHKLLDRGVLGLSDPETVVVSRTYSARTHEGRRVYDLHGLQIRPRPGTPLPAEEHVAWHSQEVFKAVSLTG